MQEQLERYIMSLSDLGEALYFAGELQQAIALFEANIAASESLDLSPELRARLLLDYAELLIADMMLNGHEASRIELVLSAAQTAVNMTTSAALRAEMRLAWGQLLHHIALNAAVGDFASSLKFAQEALEICETLDDSELLSKALFRVGLAQQFLQHLNQARDCFERSAQIARANNHRLILSYAVRHLGFIHSMNGDLESARANLEESLALREAIQFRSYLPFSYASVGEIALEQGDFTAARQHFDAAVNLARALHNRRAEMIALAGLGELAAKTGDASTARDQYQAALHIAQALEHAGFIQHIQQQMDSLSA